MEVRQKDSIRHFKVIGQMDKRKLSVGGGNSVTDTGHILRISMTTYDATLGARSGLINNVSELHSVLTYSAGLI
jgi:hypothetical protein